MRRIACLATLCMLVLALGCGRNPIASKEYAWVSAPQANLRDRVAALYNRVGTVKNGDRLEVLEHQKRFVRVRTSAGVEGWVEERYLVSNEIYSAFQKLATDAKDAPAQGHGITRASLNMHVTPQRDSDHLYQLAESQRVDLIKRGTGPKPGAQAAPRPAPGLKPAAKTAKAEAKKPDAKKAAEKPPEKPKSDAAAETPADDAAAPVLEDWWMVRDADKHVGWVLARMLDIDVPLDIAQYAEGQRLVGAYVLNTVNDPGYEPAKDDNQTAGAAVATSTDGAQAAAPAQAPGQATADVHQRPQYLVLFTEPKDGMPFDYNQVRVFTWNTRKHRYETAYREHNVFGVLPVSTGHENFDKEGNLPTFTLHVKDEAGSTVERKYKLNGPIVRRVVAAGEQAQKMAAVPHAEKSKAKKPRAGRRRR